MSNKYSYLTKNVFLFSISGFIPKILAFLLVPIYTGYLTTAEYGVSDLLTTTVSLLIPVLTLDIQDAVMRFAMDRDYRKEDVFSVAVRIILLSTGIVAIISVILSLFQIDGLEDSYLLFFTIMYFTTAAYNSVSLFCRGIEKINIMVASSIVNSAVTLIANIIFLVVFEWGLTGYLIANTLGATIALIWCFAGGKLYQYVTKKVIKTVFKDMVSFSFPLIFSVIAWWVNNASARYILTWFSGVAVSGVFAVAYKIPNVLTMFQNVFYQAWSISAIKEFDKNDSDGFMGNIYAMMNGGMVILCSCIMLVNIPLAKLLYSNDFFEAWRYVPPLLISVVLNAMAIFIGSIFTAVKDTKTLSISTIAGAVVNTICNFLFIHFWGAYGAALASLVGYAVVLIARHIILRKHIRIKIKWGRDIASYVVLLIQMVVAAYGVMTMPLQMIAVAAVALLYYKEIAGILGMVKGKLSNKKNC